MRAHPAPIKVLVKRGQLTLEGIKQFFILMDNPAWKLDTLCDLYTTETFTHPTVVFLNTRSDVNGLLVSLDARELPAAGTVSFFDLLVYTKCSSCFLAWEAGAKKAGETPTGFPLGRLSSDRLDRHVGTRH